MSIFNIYFLRDELRIKDYNKAKQSNSSCSFCYYYKKGSVINPDYCKLRKKFVKVYNFCNHFYKRKQDESTRNISTEEAYEQTDRTRDFRLL